MRRASGPQGRLVRARGSPLGGTSHPASLHVRDMSLLNLVLQAAFFAVFVAVVVRFVRERTTVNRDLAVVFASVAGLFLISLLGTLWPERPAALGTASGVLLLLMPYLTLRLTRHFHPYPRWLDLAALGGFVSSSIILVVVRNASVLAILYEVAYFVVALFVAAAFFVHAAGRRVGNARTRLALAAVSTIAFAASVIVAGAGAAMRNSAAPGSAPDTQTVAQALALVAGLGYFGAFAPPRSIRRLQQRAVAFDLAQQLVSPAEGTGDSLWARLAAAALRVTSGRAAVVALGSPPRIEAAAGSWNPAPAVGASVAAEPEEGRPPEGATSLAALLAMSGGDEILEVPLRSEVARVGALFVFMDRGELFLEDDSVLLTLLGAQTVGAVDRELALHERTSLVSQLQRTTDALEESRHLLESEARFRVALEAHPSPIVVADEVGRIAYANAVAESAFGYDQDAFRALTLPQLIGDHAEGRHNGNVAAGFIEARRRDGTTFPAELALRSFEHLGEYLQIAVLVDITERLEAEQLREKFIGVLSHELRTPVTAIYGGSQLLLSRWETMDPASARELLEDIAAEGERLHRLIENTVVLARIERGRELRGADPVLIQRVLPRVVERERSLWPAIAITLSVPPNLPTVTGDETYLAQVVRNLISNAAKYAGANGEIEVVASSTGDTVEIRVLDRGPGIDPAAADRLFELYYREPSMSLATPGAGIGLFVCRQIVQSLGGRIWARPRPGGGSEFGFSLRVYAADDDVAPAGTGDGEDLAAIS